MCDNSIVNKVIEKMKKCGRGTIFFTQDFIHYGEAKTIGKILERLTNDEMLIRLGRGIYYYPKKDKVLGLGHLLPSTELVAEAIAKHDKAKISPTGDYALNRLGFSTQIPMNLQYLTDGTSRKVKLTNGATIHFIHTTPKNLAYNSQLALMLTMAYKSLGQNRIDEYVLAKTKELLLQDTKQTVKQDYKLMPAWVSSIIKSVYEDPVFLSRQ